MSRWLSQTSHSSGIDVAMAGTAVRAVEALATEILSKLDADGLRVEDCRGQTYDNAAVMAGRRTGIQTRIREKNPSALYVPCDSHSLNLVGVHAAHVDPVMVAHTVPKMQLSWMLMT